MKRCPKCGSQYPDDANFCPVDAGTLEVVEGAADGRPVAAAPTVDTGGHEILAGRFRLGEPIGGGTTGTVYRATDVQLQSSCVVKMVAPGVFPTQLLLQRTERELKQLERLQSPSVARVLSHGKKDDTLWIASEEVQGQPLVRLVLESGPFPEARALAVVTQIGQALEQAARLGVIHRDLSPKNVLLGPGDQVRLINFGVPVPTSDRVQGVAEFVAPEQVEGKPVDQRCNIYSLGALLYFMLTGQPPFTGDVQTVLNAHVSVEPMPPSQRGAPVSPGVEMVVLKALEKASSKRYMTLRQFLGELEHAPQVDVTATTQPLGGAGPAGKAGGQPAVGDAAKTIMGMPALEEEQRAAIEAAMGYSAQSAPQVQPAPSQPTPSPQPALAQAAPAQPAAPVATPIGPGYSPVQSASSALASAQVPAGGKGLGKKAGSAGASPASNKNKFRETMWFKKGELDEAAAAAVAASKNRDSLASDKADEMAIDVRYKDDGTLTQQDQQRLSLRTGHTQMMEAMQTPQALRSGVSEQDLVSEMRGGRYKIIAGIVVGIGVIIAVIVLLAS